MNTNFRYILEPYRGMNTRYRCPSCQQTGKTFSRYIDTETGEQIHPSVGRCNRENNCGYHYTPKQYFQDNGISSDYSRPIAPSARPAKLNQSPPTFIPVDVFKASLNPTAYETNHFVQYLINLFGVEVASELVSRYFIATSNHWKGATVFWQVDIRGRIRTGKIMLYSPITGKRVKEPRSYITWAHTALNRPGFVLNQCLFGEHLLRDTTKPVAIVESEKTAIIASLYFPRFSWLAAGSLTNLTADKCRVLKGRTVMLFPDLNGFEKWSHRAKELSHLATFAVSDLLERKASEAERKQGLDLADYLLSFDLLEFVGTEPRTDPEPPAVQPLVAVKSIQRLETPYTPKPDRPKPESWDNEINELESYFSRMELPAQPLSLNPCTKITEFSLFIENHFQTVRANRGKQTFLPYLNRLGELKQLLTRQRERSADPYPPTIKPDLPAGSLII